mmetsp:Transcript_36247/g.62532  ORF Transcript_36247/g.62532 Transcript_36247/m.62532 type:complete len:200 (-) Transcript_36247:1007-1606(-)
MDYRVLQRHVAVLACPSARVLRRGRPATRFRADQPAGCRRWPPQARRGSEGTPRAAQAPLEALPAGARHHRRCHALRRDRNGPLKHPLAYELRSYGWGLQRGAADGSRGPGGCSAGAVDPPQHRSSRCTPPGLLQSVVLLCLPGQRVGARYGPQVHLLCGKAHLVLQGGGAANHVHVHVHGSVGHELPHDGPGARGLLL